jgi:hypothetical protein
LPWGAKTTVIKFGALQVELARQDNARVCVWQPRPLAEILGFAGLSSAWYFLFLCRGLPVGNKLYVGNLAYSVRDESLQEAFSQFGSVTSAKVMMDRETGRSKGFGFVEMGSDAEAQAAVNGMNGQALEGRAIVVNEARPREERPGGFGGGGGGRSGGGGYGGGSQGGY